MLMFNTFLQPKISVDIYKEMFSFTKTLVFIILRNHNFHWCSPGA